MRISDWSSDVCSSDLRRQLFTPLHYLIEFGANQSLVRFQDLRPGKALTGIDRRVRQLRDARDEIFECGLQINGELLQSCARPAERVCTTVEALRGRADGR